VRELRLVDCEQHGCMLPYLQLLPELQVLRILSSSVEHDPLLPVQSLKSTNDETGSSAGQGASNPYDMYATPLNSRLQLRDPLESEAAEVAAEARATGRPVLPPIRALDFLSLADCRSLSVLQCHYPVRAAAADKDDRSMNERRALEDALQALRADKYKGGGRLHQQALEISWECS
jgi:hypothetical protein